MNNQEEVQLMLNEHSEWQSKIRMYKSELKRLNADLSELVTRETPSEIMASVEHFQNQFIRQNEVLDIIRHEFKQHENLLESLQKNGSSDIDLEKRHSEERDKLFQFERIFKELEKEFEMFLQSA